MSLHTKLTFKNAKQRPCDACSLRRVRCSGGQPCLACARSEIPCTALRVIGKVGPKKPRRNTIEAIEKARHTQLQRRSRSESIRTSISPSASPVHYGDVFNSLDLTFLTPRDFSPQSAASFEQHPLDYLFSTQLLLDPPRIEDCEQRYSWPILLQYIEVFEEKLSKIFPICNLQLFLDLISHYDDYLEIYVLCAAVAAATMSQLQLPSTVVNSDELIAGSDGFAQEAIRKRNNYDYRNNASIIACLTSAFLHVYHTNAGQITAATLAIREAATYLQILKLDQESEYQRMDIQERELKRSLFWSLFITERAFTMTFKMAPILKPAIKFLNINHHNEPAMAGFITLATLFVQFNNKMLSLNMNDQLYDQDITREEIIEIKRQMDQATESSSFADSVQIVDALVTKQWINMLCWQISLSVGHLSSFSESSCMRFAFPGASCIQFVKDISLTDVTALSSHGVGMEYKLFEICHTLANVILCRADAHGETSYRSCLGRLMNIFTTFRSKNNPQLVSIMSDKLSQIHTACDDLRHDLMLVPISSNSTLPPEDDSQQTENEII